MPTAILPPVLPPAPPQAWTKPTFENTRGGKTYRPTHPELFSVEFTTGKKGLEEGYASRLVAARDFGPKELITRLTNLSLAAEKAYSSVQYGSGPKDHFELNSDLLFMNHSCSPSVEMHLPQSTTSEWAVYAGAKGVRKGEPLTFFYPSTEWDMAQSFDCACGSDNCLVSVNGAKYTSLEDLQSRSYINEHILRLKATLDD